MTQIINRFTGAVITSGDMNLRELVVSYVKEKGYRADLCGADLYGIKIKSCAVFTGLYKYIAMPVIADDGSEHIRLGCHFRPTADWAADFWNNPEEFPNNGDMDSKLRWMVYQTCLQWLEINREVNNEP